MNLRAVINHAEITYHFLIFVKLRTFDKVLYSGAEARLPGLRHLVRVKEIT